MSSPSSTRLPPSPLPAALGGQPPDKVRLLRFSCLSCRNVNYVLPEYAGKLGRCPKCREVMRIPCLTGDLEEPPRQEEEGVGWAPALVGLAVAVLLGLLAAGLFALFSSTV